MITQIYCHIDAFYITYFLCYNNTSFVCHFKSHCFVIITNTIVTITTILIIIAYAYVIRFLSCCQYNGCPCHYNNTFIPNNVIVTTIPASFQHA